MGSPVSPIVADVYMEFLEQTAIATVPLEYKPRLWKRYVDNILDHQQTGSRWSHRSSQQSRRYRQYKVYLRIRSVTILGHVDSQERRRTCEIAGLQEENTHRSVLELRFASSDTAQVERNKMFQISN